MKMDSEGSSRGVLSRQDSEMGSRYVLESGVYLSSFSAAILIASLVTIGVVMLTMVVALSVMLKSCQRSNPGYFDQVKSNDQYAYCNYLAFYSEINNLEEHEYPASCKQHQIQYINSGRYLRDLNFTLNIAESYFSTLQPNDDGLDIILVYVDDIFPPHISYSSNSTSFWSKQAPDMKHQSSKLILSLLLKLQETGWSLRFCTRRSMKEVDAIMPCFELTSFGECSSLIHGPYDEVQSESWDYISSRRVLLQNQRFRIASIISCRMDAFQGPPLGKRNFKLACPSNHMLTRANMD